MPWKDDLGWVAAGKGVGGVLYTNSWFSSVPNWTLMMSLVVRILLERT